MSIEIIKERHEQPKTFDGGEENPPHLAIAVDYAPRRILVEISYDAHKVEDIPNEELANHVFWAMNDSSLSVTPISVVDKTKED